MNALLGQQARGFLAQAPQELARTFGVEPLGPRHGLVEWVEDTAPLYNVYKQHAQHAALVEAWLGAPCPSYCVLRLHEGQLLLPFCGQVRQCLGLVWPACPCCTSPGTAGVAGRQPP